MLLLCVECNTLSAGDGTGWPGYRVDACNGAEPPQLVFCCPACAIREFGLLLPRWQSRLGDELDVD